MFTTMQVPGFDAVMPAIASPEDAEPTTSPGPVPCAARPSTGFVHLDGSCRCFFGGEAPEFAPPPVLDTLRHAS